MSTVTVIVGLCGSGKSYYLRQMTGVKKFEEGVRPDIPELQKNWDHFLNMLREGNDCAIIECFYLNQYGRDQLVRLVRGVCPNAIFRWACFENDFETAKWNCLNDRHRTKEEAEGAVALNRDWTRLYTIPEGAEVHKIYRLPPR